MSADDFRSRILRDHGARDSELGELLAYTVHAFGVTAEDRERSYPLADEPCVATWQRYAEQGADVGTFESLRRHLVQLRFPIAAGISQDPVYLRATRQGISPDDELQGLSLTQPGRVRLLIHPTPAGRIPVLVAANRKDFESLLRALTRHNEPEPIPPAVGAMMVAGYNNWDRIHEIRSVWSKSHPFGDWAVELRKLLPARHLYQDRFILLSSGPYSDVTAESMGFTDEDWLEKSVTIRLEHECAHYFTRRVFGVMRNSLHDELIADYMGIVAAAGAFRADWFLRFLGLEAFPRLRPGGRLENYRGDPPLSDGAFKVLQSLISSAAANLEEADRRRHAAVSVADRARTLCGLAGLTLEEMAGDDGGLRLSQSLA